MSPLARIQPLNVYLDDRGALTDIARSGPDDEAIGQVYTTTCAPGVIKAWHRHQFQTDRWVCLRGAVKVGLYDKETETFNTAILSERLPTKLIIPPGIWHGFTPVWGSQEALILNTPSKPYNEEQPDEERLPVDALDFDWSVKSR